jgi:hypothetical protein
MKPKDAGGTATLKRDLVSRSAYTRVNGGGVLQVTAYETPWLWPGPGAAAATGYVPRWVS